MTQPSRGAALRLAQTLSAVFFRSVEVQGAERVPAQGPLLFVANHGNALVDPLLLLARLPRAPRFLAKHTLWRNPIVRPLLSLAGAIPVFRRQDGAEGSSNDRTFERCREELARGGAIALFPEGISHDRPAIQPLKTGAARIALDTLHANPGLPLRIVPVGLSFESRAEFRSRALIVIGEPLAPEAGAGAGAAPDPDAVRALTARIEAGLRAVTLNFSSLEESQIAMRAADLYAEDERVMPGEPELALRFPLRRAFGESYARARASEPERVARVEALVRRYDALLARSRLRDDQVSARYPKRLAAWYVGSRAQRLALALPVAALGTLLNYVPYRVPGLVAGFAGEHRDLPATYKILTGLALAPLCWALWVALAAWLGGASLALVTALVAPASGWFALRFHEQNEAFWSELRAWLVLRLFPARARELRALRARIRGEVEALVAELGPAPGPAPGHDAGG